MVRDQYQAMRLVIPQKLTLTDLMYTPTVMFIVVSLAVVSGLGTIILPVTANLNFWSRAIFWNLALLEKCTNPERKCMRTRSVCGFFLTWVGSYENISCTCLNHIPTPLLPWFRITCFVYSLFQVGMHTYTTVHEYRSKFNPEIFPKFIK